MADRRRPNIVLLVVIAIAVLAVAALLVGGRGDDDDATSSGSRSPSSSTGRDSSASETRPVRVRGTVLPPFKSSDDDPAVGMQAPVVDGTSFAGRPVSIGTG